MTSPVSPSGDSFQPPAAPPSDQPAVRDEYAPQHDSPLQAAEQVIALAEAERAAVRRRRVRLPVLLFLATCFSTFWAGASGLYGMAAFDGIDYFVKALWHAVWDNGLTYMFAVMGILLAHEMGHFLMALRHRIPASLPYFIPMPLPPIGTMGAVIAMQGSRADRKQLFDIGLAGPLAGLVVALPVLCAGIFVAEPVNPQTAQAIVTRLDGGKIKKVSFAVSQPLMTRLLVPCLRPDLAGRPVRMNALLMAGWVGLLITGLNMMPLSQLDGGHVAYALFRRRAHHLANALFFVAIIYIVVSAQLPWVLMLALVALIGIHHPPTANDHVPLGKLRMVLGWASLIIPVLCFPPAPFQFDMP